MNERLSIGITGGIGCGKSYISKVLSADFGIPVYDCDKEAKRLTASSGEIRRQLVSLVGPDVYDASGLNRQRLADYIFADAGHAQRAGAIIHPAVLKDFHAWAEKQQQPIVALESAILFESGFNRHVDYVLFVDAPEGTRLRRAMQRDSATEAQVRTRMKMQQPEQYRSLADFIIDNSTEKDPKLHEHLARIVSILNSQPPTQPEKLVVRG